MSASTPRSQPVIRQVRQPASLKAEALFNRMREDQRALADHLLSSWRVREFFTGRAVTCEGNYHLPVVRRAIKTTLERRP